MLENGRQTSFVYHNGELLHEQGREEQKTSYHLGAGIDAFRRGQKLYYYQQDEQLSTALVTDGQGGTHNSYLYDAFGVEMEINEQFPNYIRYTSQQYDVITEQYYLRTRCYNSVLGRFMQEDVYQGDGLNLYTYCHNNPVVLCDQSRFTVNNHSNTSNTTPNIDYGSINKFGHRSGIIAEVTPQMIGTGTTANSHIKPPGWINGIAVSEGGQDKQGHIYWLKIWEVQEMSRKI